MVVPKCKPFPTFTEPLLVAHLFIYPLKLWKLYICGMLVLSSDYEGNFGCLARCCAWLIGAGGVLEGPNSCRRTTD
jgi:hypothetical protein